MTVNITNPVAVRGVSAYLLKGRGKNTHFLLMRRTDRKSSFWAQVAGKIEENETAWQAALREVKEETSLTPASFYSADICEQFYEIDRDSIWLSPVFVGFIDESHEVVLNEEHDIYEWVSLEQATERLIFASQRNAVKTIWEEFVERKPSHWLLIDQEALERTS